MVNILFSWGIG